MLFGHITFIKVKEHGNECSASYNEFMIKP